MSARARKQKYISIYISLYMKTFLKTGVYIYIYIYIHAKGRKNGMKVSKIMITLIHRKTKINNEQSKTLDRGSIRCKKKRRVIYTKEN